jgi:putative endonuclease
MTFKNPAVYILASQRNGTLYIGVTSDLVGRVWQHKNKVIEGFSKQYDISMLVYYEIHDTMESAITQEKQFKKWNRQWKMRLIEDTNPSWSDLYDEISEHAL